MLLVFRWLLATGLGMGSVLAGEPGRSPIPLEKGTKWFYEAEVKWTPASGPAARGLQSRHWKWTMEVLETVDAPAARVAVVRGCPDEIAGMDPAIPNGYSVLLEASNRLYRVAAGSRREALAVARRLAATSPPWPAGAEVLLELPLTVGKRWGDQGDDPTRADGWYCWHVEASKEKAVQVQGFSGPPLSLVSTVAYRTGPDHQLMEVAPGLGIIRFEYEHHGTVASASVRLVKFKRGVSK